MPLKNLPENYLYELMPTGVSAADRRGLVRTIISGYQDRISDLRALATNVLEDEQVTTILVSFTADSGIKVSRALTKSADTPDGEAERKTWAAAELGVAEDAIVSVVEGTDALQTPLIDTLLLTAANFGAEIYDPYSEDSQQQQLDSFFPRLRIKGTVNSVEALARLLGYEATRIPLWSHVLPAHAEDSSALNKDGFTSRPDIPLTSPAYSPSSIAGDYLAWDAGTLSPDTAPAWATSVNAANPFVRFALADAAVLPPAGYYRLTGGGVNPASVAVGTWGSAVARLAGESDTTVAVETLSGSEAHVTVTGRLSHRSYRSSYFALAATVPPESVEFEGVSPSTSLSENPTLLPDGEAQYPYLPFVGGTQPRSVVVWPSVSESLLPGDVPRVQAVGTESEVSGESVRLIASKAAPLAGENPANYVQRRFGVGLGFSDTVPVAPFVSEFNVTSSDALVLTTADRPSNPHTAAVQVFRGGVAIDTYTDSGSVLSFGAADLTGTYSPVDGSVKITNSGGAYSAVLTFTLTSQDSIGDEPGLADKEADNIDSALPDSVAGDAPLTGEFVSYSEDGPAVGGGVEVDTVGYRPYTPDLTLLPVSKHPAPTSSGVATGVSVIDVGVEPFQVRSHAAYEENALPLSALSDEGTVPLVEVGGLLVAKALLSTSRTKDIALWVPLGEHPSSSLDPYATGSVSAANDILHSQRVWDDERGWVLNLNRGHISVGYQRPLAKWTAAFWLYPTGSGQTVFTVGGTPITVTTASTITLACGGAESDAADLDRWLFASVSFDGSDYSVSLTEAGGAFAWQDSAAGTFVDTTMSAHFVSASTLVHDFIVWSSVKSVSDIQNVKAPHLDALDIPDNTPFVQSTRWGDKYVLRLLDSGFVYPDKADVVTVGNTPALAVRHDTDGSFFSDARYKALSVGLGDGVGTQPAYPLGLRFGEIAGDGSILLAGSQPPPLGFVASYGTNTAIEHRYNAATDAVYVSGDTDDVYRVFVSDTGDGAFLGAERVLTILYGTQERRVETNAITLLGVTGHVLSVDSDGEPYSKADAGQVLNTPPLYLYNNDQRVIADPILPLWDNPNAVGTTLGVPALAANGDIVLRFDDALAAGAYRIDFSASNSGITDRYFDGFDLTLAVKAVDGTLVHTENATWLEGAADTDDPASVESLTFRCTETLVGGWTVTLRWTNWKDVSSYGRARLLAISAADVYRLNPRLYRVAVDPLTLTEVNVGATTGLLPGGMVGFINSYGTICEYRHEANWNPDLAPYPVSNRLTLSSHRRWSCLEVLNPDEEDDGVLPDAPVLLSTDVDPGTQCNVGQSVSLSATVDDPTLVSTYVWRLYDNTVAVTTTPEAEVVLGVGTGPDNLGHYSVEAVDHLGRSSKLWGVIDVNPPPELSISAYPLFGKTPYTAQLYGTVSTHLASTHTLTWFANGEFVGTGSPLPFDVLRPTRIVAQVEDDLGGVTEAALELVGRESAPIVSSIHRPNVSRRSSVDSLRAAAYAIDPENGDDLTFEWDFWGTLSPDRAEFVTDTGVFFGTASCPLEFAPPGFQPITLKVTDSAGRSTVTSSHAYIQENFPPTIVSVSTPRNGGVAGREVEFSAVGQDSDGDPLLYFWSFTQPVVRELEGPAIVFTTLPEQEGLLLAGTLAVRDRFGAQAVAAIPSIELFGTECGNIIVTAPPGFYTQGFVQSFSSENSEEIRYMVDGGEIHNVTDGLRYDGPFLVNPPTTGTGRRTIRARAFAAGAAPSYQFIGDYVFYSPEQAGEVVGVPLVISGESTAMIATNGAVSLSEPILPFTPPGFGDENEGAFVTLSEPI